MTDKDNFVQTFKWNSTTGKYLIDSYTDAYNNQIIFKRNDKGQVIEISEKNKTSNQPNILITYTNDKISKVQYGDHWTTFEYTDNKLTKTTIGSDKSNRRIIEKFEYNSEGQLVKYTDGKNNETFFEYKGNKLVIFDKKEKDEEVSVTKTYTFNPVENEYIVTDSSGNETVYKRDEKNNSFTVSQIETPGEDDQNKITTYTYDEQYNVTKVVNADGSTETYTYDSKGNLLTSTTKDGTTKNTYNEQNQLVKSVSPNGEVTINTYEGPFLISTKVNDEETKFEYDKFGRVIKTIFPNNTYEEVSYDDEARKVTTTDKKGNTSSVTYSIFGQKLEEVDAEGHKKTYTYDPIYPESITSVTDGNGHKTSYEYDNNNNLTVVTDALGRQKKYTYNDNDQVTSITLPGMKFQYHYDINGELSQSILPSGITTTYTYNESGQLEQVVNGDETIEYQYDENGNTTKILRNGQTLKTMDHDLENNLLATYKIGQFTQEYHYDEHERETKRTTTYQNGLSIVQNTNYKENSDDIDYIQYGIGNDILHSYQSDINVTDNQSTLNLNNGLLKKVTQLNDANLLSSITYTSKVQQPFEIKYEYTKNGNIKKETVNGKESTFEYDQNNQLIKETLPDGTINTYEYDAVGNRIRATINGVTSTFTYNDANQITKKNGVEYKYDVDGNLIQDENYKYTYNQQQRLTKVETLDGKTVASYTYDENGLRLTKAVGNTTYEYFYNDEVLEMEVVKVNNEITEYRYYEWNGYTPLGMIIKVKNDNGEFETKVYQFITNHRGDVLIIRDSEDQEVGSYQYDAYGNVLTVEGTVARENPIRYAGYYYDEETKNYYLQARYYNPANGSFLALDPHPGDADEPLSQNGYTYANNNPVMNVDPDGEVAWAIVGAVSSGIIAWVMYNIEVKLKIRKYSKASLIAKVGTAAALGAISGGIIGFGKFGGLLNRALKAGVLTKKEVKLYKKFIKVKHMVLNKVVNWGSKKPGSETWASFVIKKMRQFGIKI